MKRLSAAATRQFPSRWQGPLLPLLLAGLLAGCPGTVSGPRDISDGKVDFAPAGDGTTRDGRGEDAAPGPDGSATDGLVTDGLVTDGPVSQTLKITSPASGASLQQGSTVTLQGSGKGTLSWSYDANSDGLAEVAIGTGASVSFKVPTGVKAPMVLTLFLADTTGKINQTHPLTTGPVPDAGPLPDSAAPADSGPPPTCKGFAEKGGLVVVEVESAPLAGDWTKRTSNAGYTGSGYYEWRYGDPATGTVAAGTGILSYAVCVATAGRYQLHIRSAAPHSTEHNDVWVRFPDTGAVRNKGQGDTSLGTSWFKVYENTSNNTWQWKTLTKDNDGHQIYVDVAKGQGFKVEFSGRSTQFKVDRFVLRHASVTVADATKTTNPESLKQ